MSAYAYLEAHGTMSARLVKSGDLVVSFQPPEGPRLTCISRPSKTLDFNSAREKAARVILDKLESEGTVIHMDEL